MPKSDSPHRRAQSTPIQSETWKNSSGAAVIAIGVCGALLICFYLLGWSASWNKSPTADEPLHLVGAWTESHLGDFRVNPEDPPLWKFWAAAGTTSDDLKINRSSPTWDAMLGDESRFDFAKRTLYAPGTNVSEMLRSARARMMVVGVLLGIAIGWWAWRLAGPLAAVVGVAVFSLDPNFLGHSPLVKNDVSMTLVFVVFAGALWLAGEKATALRATALAWIVGAVFVVKFSAVLAVPMLAIALVARVVMPTAWPVLHWTARTHLQRLAAAGAIFVSCAIASYVLIWACYGFRFSPDGQGGKLFDQSAVMSQLMKLEAVRDHGMPAEFTDEQLSQWMAGQNPGLMDKAYRWGDDHHVLPQAYLRGFYYTWGRGLIRACYLLGEDSRTGWWYYFPLTFAFKTPLATLIGLALCAICWMWVRRGADAWTLCACLVCPVFYGAAAMWENLNLGLRHLFPIYPFLFIFLGVAFAALWRRRPGATAAIGGLLLIGLAVETLCAYPDYIAFFNVAAGGSRGGLRLLGDSNLDWGQDLPALARWQAEHPDAEIYLRYFGPDNPNYYGLRYVYLNLDGRITHPEQVSAGARRKVLAISATDLQGIYLWPEQRERIAELRHQKPIAVLGGSIYLFDHVDDWLKRMQQLAPTTRAAVSGM
jgi:hypothetical protein